LSAMNNRKRRVMTLAAVGTAFAAINVLSGGFELPFGRSAPTPPMVQSSAHAPMEAPSWLAEPQPEVTRAGTGGIVVFAPQPEQTAPLREPPLLAIAVPAGDDPAFTETGRAHAVMPQRFARADTRFDEQPVPADPSVQTGAPEGCEIGFTAMAAPAAMVNLALEAPCFANRVVEFSHAGLRFTEVTDENGVVQIAVPAMEEMARFTAAFQDGSRATAEVLMLTLGGYSRIALTWEGETGFDLHALENGAGYGEPGHVWAGAQYGPERAVLGEGGFAVRLGGLPVGHTAMVYSHPAHLADTWTDPEISIEAEVLPATCERTISGKFLRAVPGAEPMVSEVTIAAPGCDAVGEFLVLKNPIQDRRIAHN
jgi:hypothetical protein